MTYSDFKQLIADAQNDDHMKVNLVDASFKPGAWNRVSDYINYLDNLENFNDAYTGRITYEPAFDINNRISKVFTQIRHPANDTNPEREDWLLWEVIYDFF